MTLAALIRGARVADSGKSATATLATPATLEGAKGRTVATVATVAVANPQKSIVATGSVVAVNEARRQREHADARRQEAHPDLAARPSTAAQGDSELFTFAPPGDPVNDTEAVAERAAILAVESGMDDTTALQEARWQADRERAWRAFLRNAQRILEVPAHDRKDLLITYQTEAAGRYGERTGTDMAKSLESWVLARRVH